MSAVRIPWLACVLAVVAMAGCSRSADLTPLDNSGGALTAKRISGDPPLDPDAAAWQTTDAREIALYPQIALPVPGKAEPAAQQGVVSMRALYSDTELAVRLEWNDPGADAVIDVEHFADALAVAWPTQYGRGVSLPYVGMGNPGNPVTLWFWRADDTTETLAAEGFGSTTTQSSTQSSERLQSQGRWKDGKWAVVLKQARAPIDGGTDARQVKAQSLLPFAVATWDGAAAQRDGLKRLSSWRVLYLDGSDVDPDYLQQLASPVIQGDPTTGKRLMTDKGCVACHTYPGNPAQPAIGPNLTYAGGLHRSDYLLESILDPSQVVVPGKGYATVQDGKPVSLMPPFQGTDRERQDLLAYLKTLR